MMMMMKTLILVAILSGCSSYTWRQIDRGTLASSTALLAIDAAQTINEAAYGWQDGRAEYNPIQGFRPGVATVATYSATVILANIVLWAVLPSKWRSAVPAAVTGMELVVVGHNFNNSCAVSFGPCLKFYGTTARH